MLRGIGVVVVALLLLVAFGDDVGLGDQRLWLVREIQGVVGDLEP